LNGFEEPGSEQIAVIVSEIENQIFKIETRPDLISLFLDDGE